MKKVCCVEIDEKLIKLMTKILVWTFFCFDVNTKKNKKNIINNYLAIWIRPTTNLHADIEIIGTLWNLSYTIWKLYFGTN